MKSLLTIVTGATALPALAHDGHGLFGAHWHATDALGFVAAQCVGAALGIAAARMLTAQPAP